jgi:hypothetical protein
VEVNGLLRAVVSSSRERFIAGCRLASRLVKVRQTGVTEGNRVHHRGELQVQGPCCLSLWLTERTATPTTTPPPPITSLCITPTHISHLFLSVILARPGAGYTANPINDKSIGPPPQHLHHPL